METDLNLKKIEELEEVELWREIDGVFALFQVASSNRTVYGLLGDEYTKLGLYYQQLVYQTKKFGVEFDDEEYGQNFRESPSFKFWRAYWLKILMGLGRERYFAFQERKLNAKDIKELLPKESWKDEYQSQKGMIK